MQSVGPLMGKALMMPIQTQYRIIWFYDGHVTGINSYKDSTPASSCTGYFKSIRWEDAFKDMQISLN